METILVPIDFSKNALNALDYAVRIAEKTNASIILLNTSPFSVINPITPVTLIKGKFQAAIKNDGKLQKLCDEISSNKKIKCVYANKEGDPVTSITTIAKNKDIDLIIMGTKGADGLKEIFVGSNTAEVIEASPCPVIAIPENVIYKKLQKITFATDYRKNDLLGLSYVAKLAKPFMAEIQIIHIAEGDFGDDAEEIFMKQFIKKATGNINYDNISFQILHSNKVLKKLNELVVKEQIDLLVMSTRKRNLLTKLVDKSVTRKMVHRIRIPLMAFHSDEPVER